MNDGVAIIPKVGIVPQPTAQWAPQTSPQFLAVGVRGNLHCQVFVGYEKNHGLEIISTEMQEAMLLAGERSQENIDVYAECRSRKNEMLGALKIRVVTNSPHPSSLPNGLAVLPPSHVWEGDSTRATMESWYEGILPKIPIPYKSYMSF